MAPSSMLFQLADDLWSPGDLHDLVVIRAESSMLRVTRQPLVQFPHVLESLPNLQDDASSGNMEREYLEGIMILPLHDTANETERILRAALRHTWFGQTSSGDLQLGPFLGVLRLAHKYQAKPLFRQALVKLGEI
ncbi:unnamed protein product [Mycena citricolor]|uniref:Uncharacterized protein n=1 Tax=Mycena citricolor TaxID=2018698 RepID=A0AAD2Q1T9_9AGAR|nr:unnamed protein product [Mycena citricolor]